MKSIKDILPLEPMTPISCETLPSGEEWGYQLKWDGVRIISKISIGRNEGSEHRLEHRSNHRSNHRSDSDHSEHTDHREHSDMTHPLEIQLYSRKMLDKNLVYPEVVSLLREAVPPDLAAGGLILDGEVVVFDPEMQRPVFQLVLQRERFRASELARTKWPVTYVLFDLLYLNGEDLRPLPYSERHRRLQELFPERRSQLFVSDIFPDGASLWEWVSRNGWEGVVAKRLTSPYRIGKKHTDWYKKKTALLLDVTIAGVTIRGGHAASMVMLHDNMYLGRVSLGLDASDRERLLQYANTWGDAPPPFSRLPAELAKEEIIWLSKPFQTRVTGLEITAAGMLRHPKLVSFRLPEE